MTSSSSFFAVNPWITKLSHLWLLVLTVALIGNGLIIYYVSPAVHEEYQLQQHLQQHPFRSRLRRDQQHPLDTNGTIGNIIRQKKKIINRNKKEEQPKSEVSTATNPLQKVESKTKLTKTTSKPKTTTITRFGQRIGRPASHIEPGHPTDETIFSICLLTKDDVDILPEWIAYHYHALALRHLVVAVDPRSETKPTELFQTFRRYLPKLQIEEWDDLRFMPDFFLNQSYGEVPNFMGRDIQHLTFNQWVKEYKIRPVIAKDMYIINNHRYRQSRFVSQCIQHLRKQGRTFVSPLDSDEYIVINPLLTEARDFTKHDHPWQTLESGSVLRFFEHSIQGIPETALNRSCVGVPRILFGSVPSETPLRFPSDNDAAHQFNTSRFETLQWKYHTSYHDERNHLQKVIMDIPRIPFDDEYIFGDHAYSVHQPSPNLCSPETFYSNFSDTIRHPLIANHYLGSWERYNARQDKRRSRKVCLFVLGERIP